jgi:serine/threonine-protein kinase
MSPEQARGEDVDHRGDIFSLCTVVYETITGQPPFQGKNHNAVLHQIVATEPAPTTALAAGDGALWSILQKGLAKDPDRRFQSMRDLAAALSAWAIERGITEDIAGGKLEATLQDLGPQLEPAFTLPPAATTPTEPPRAGVATLRGAPRRSARGQLVLTAVLATTIGAVVWIAGFSGAQGGTESAVAGSAPAAPLPPRTVGAPKVASPEPNLQRPSGSLPSEAASVAPPPAEQLAPSPLTPGKPKGKPRHTLKDPFR